MTMLLTMVNSKPCRTLTRWHENRTDTFRHHRRCRRPYDWTVHLHTVSTPVNINTMSVVKLHGYHHTNFQRSTFDSDWENFNVKVSATDGQQLDYGWLTTQTGFVLCDSEKTPEFCVGNVPFFHANSGTKMTRDSGQWPLIHTAGCQRKPHNSSTS